MLFVISWYKIGDQITQCFNIASILILLWVVIFRDAIVISWHKIGN